MLTETYVIISFINISDEALILISDNIKPFYFNYEEETYGYKKESLIELLKKHDFINDLKILNDLSFDIIEL